jgi:peroxiredoxin
MNDRIFVSSMLVLGEQTVKHVTRWIVPSALALSLFAGRVQAQGAASPDASKPAEQASPASLGKEALQRAAEEIKKASAITYQFDIRAEGILAAAYPNSRGQVWAMRDDKATGTGGWLIRIMGESEGKDGAKLSFDMAWRTGNEIEWVDYEAQKVKSGQGRQPSSGKGVMVAQKARLSELLATAPLASELAATTFEDLPTDTVSGEACSIVRFPGKRANTKLEWAIAQSDAMPRRVTQVSDGSFSSTVTLTTSDWIVETGTPQRVTQSDLRVAKPEGFTEEAATTPMPAGGGAGGQQYRPITPPSLPAPGSDVPKPAENTQPEPKPEPKADPAPQPVEPASPKLSEAAPIVEPSTGPRLASDFELATADGTKIALKDLRGKVVVLQFFGSWCLPCQPWHKQIVDAVEEGAADRVGDVRVLAIAVRERDPQNATQEIVRAGVGDAMTVLLKGERVAQQWGVKLFPTTLVIDREGRIRAELRGETSTGNFESLRETIRTVVGESSSMPEPIAAPTTG